MSDESMRLLAKRLQPVLSRLAQEPAYAEYVKQHKLSLLDDKLAIYDELLNRGFLTA